MWYKVIKSKFVLHPNQWDSKVVEYRTHRSPWKAMSSLYGEFYQMVSFKVGNGNKVRFWEDIWLGENSLEVLFPSLLRLSISKSQPISKFWINLVLLWVLLQVRIFTFRVICRTERFVSCNSYSKAWKGSICARLLKIEEIGWLIHRVLSRAS